MSRLKQIFTECQKTIAVHPKLIKSLTNVYVKSDFNAFFSEFTSLLKKSLIYADKQPCVDRTLNFVGKFATSRKSEKDKKPEDEDEDDAEEADPFLVKLIGFLLNNHEANGQGVRLRVCQLINILLNNLGEEAVIDDELYNSIYDTMLQRLQDKVPSVRVQAVMAVGRLQDPRNKECPVIKAYRYHLSMDPNPDVRRAVLFNIAITYQTLPDILERTRDVRDTVRRQAYELVSKRVHLKSLTIAQRVRLISEGLKDRSDMVRNFVEKKLMEAWLKMVNDKVLDLLTCLDVEASVAEAELAIKAIFQNLSNTDLMDNFGLDKDQKIIPISELQPESALYWRCLAEHLRNEGAEEALDTILPELTKFCQYVRDFFMANEMDTGDEEEMALRSMERKFVIKQIVSMTMLYDLADEVGRRSLDQLIRTLLVSDRVHESLVKGLVEVFGKLHPPNARVTQLAEIISEIQEPASKTIEKPLSEEEKRKRRLQVAHVKVKINQVKEELEECVRSKTLDIDRAKLLKEELQRLEDEAASINLETTVSEEVVEEVRNDAETLIKCLMIICNMVESEDITVMNPTLHSLHENLVLTCLRSENPAVRNQGVRALGLFCMLSKELAHQHIMLCMQISRIDVEEIQITAVKIVIDMLHLYGLEEFIEAAGDINAATEDSSPSRNREKEEEFEGEGGAIVSALCQMMDVDSTDVRTVVAEGLCKLLLACRINSSKLLSRLILMWYNPATEDENLLRHMLGVFFPLYASDGGSNQESLCEAFLPTLHTIFKAPSRSPLADVDVDDLANFLVSITSPAIVSEECKSKVNTHDTLVFSLCTDILAYPNSRMTKVLIKCLSHLQLTPTNYPNLRQVNVLAEKISKCVKERNVLNSVMRFHNSIKALLKSAPETETESEVAPSENTAEKIVENINESGAGDSMANKTLDNTVMRKKRMLYNSQSASDPEMLSSDNESNTINPMKRLARSPSSNHLDNESSDPGTPMHTSTQVINTKPPESSPTQEKTKMDDPQPANTPPTDTEIELTQNIVKEEKVSIEHGDSDDLFESSQESSVLTQEKLPQELPTTPTRKSSAGDDSSSPQSSGRRRSKKESSTGQSSEEESTPKKIARISEQTVPLKERTRKTRSSQSSDSAATSESNTPTRDTISETSEGSGSSSDFVNVRTSRGSRRQTQRKSQQNTPTHESISEISEGSSSDFVTTRTFRGSRSQTQRKSTETKGSSSKTRGSKPRGSVEKITNTPDEMENTSRGTRSSRSSQKKASSSSSMGVSPQVQSVSSEDATPVRRSPRYAAVSSTSESDSPRGSVSSSSSKSTSGRRGAKTRK